MREKQAILLHPYITINHSYLLNCFPNVLALLGWQYANKRDFEIYTNVWLKVDNLWSNYDIFLEVLML